MKISIISGSSRASGQSGKVARVIAQSLATQEACTETYLFDLADNPLPLWDDSIWGGDEAWQQRLSPISAQLASSDAIIIIAPEWHGMVPAGLKNFFLMWGKGELAHKPGLLVGVSSGDGGAYPIAELRMSSYKNNRLCWLPEQLIARQVKSLCNEDASQNNGALHDAFSARCDYALELLLAYASALKPIRNGGLIDHETYMNGM